MHKNTTLTYKTQGKNVSKHITIMYQNIKNVGKKQQDCIKTQPEFIEKLNKNSSKHVTRMYRY